MYNCRTCNGEIAKEQVILTDYFQVHLEKGQVYPLCGECYLKEIDRYLEEEKPLCSCGAREVRHFDDDDDDETISMGIEDALLNLTCEEAKRMIKSGEKSEDEIEDEGFHTYNSQLYIRWFSDEDAGWV